MIKLKRILPLFLPLMAAATLGSCSDDRLPAAETATVPNPDLSTQPGTVSIAFAIKSGTEILGRATVDDIDDAQQGDYIDGKYSEHRIGPGGNYAIFFKPDNTFHSYSFLTPGDDMVDERPNVEVYFRAKITGLEEQLPLNCMIVVNASVPLSETIMNLSQADNLTTALAKLVEANADPYNIGVNRNGNDIYLTMTTSAYIENGAVRRTVPVTEANVQDEEIGFDQAKVVHVQVERMLGKFSFKISPADGVKYDPESHVFTYANNEIIYCSGFLPDGSPQHEPRQWKAQVTGWGINALEKKEHALKNISPTGNYFTDWTWNVPADWRTYWAEDFNYTQNDYPWQYRPTYNNKKVSSNTGNYPVVPYYGEKGNNNYLLNYSYTQLDNHDLSRYVYVPENTYDAAKVGNLDSRTDLLAGTHLIVTARMLTNLKDPATFTATDVYRDINGVFYTDPRDAFWAQVVAFNRVLESQKQMRFHAYAWDNNETRNLQVGDTLTAWVDGGRYRLYMGDRELTRDMVMNLGTDFFQPAYTKDGDGKLLPWIDGLSIRTPEGDPLKIYHYIDERINITSDNPSQPNTNDLKYLGYATDNDFKSIWLEWSAEMEHYADGRMYYAAPAILRKAETEQQKDICGVVRNNWYSYSLTDIRKMGYPVDRPTDPIVPNTTSLYDRLNITVDIIDWHKITTTGSILP